LPATAPSAPVNAPSADQRAYAAILAGRGWADGQTAVSEARRAAFNAHVAARQTELPTAQFAIRSAGHAAARRMSAPMRSPPPTMRQNRSGALEERAGNNAHLISLLQAFAGVANRR
jgi:hypothetical protein